MISRRFRENSGQRYLPPLTQLFPDADPKLIDLINKVMSFSMNILGGSKFTWKVQHNMLHHSYTNVYHLM